MKQKLAFALSFSLLIGLLFVAPAAQVGAADNLAANGDLETGNTSGWEIANASIDSSVKYAGNYSLKLNATSAYSGAAYKIVPVGKGATVTVSFYYRYASDPGSGKTYHIYTYQGENASVGPYSNADKSLAVPSGCDSISTWKQVSYSFNSGDYDKIYLKFCPGGNGSSACYIDNLVVTATGGVVDEVAPYLTSFGTKNNRPSNANYNLIKNGGFESTDNAQWNTSSFLKDNLSVAEDSSAKEGSKSLVLRSAGSGSNATKYTFPVEVEKYTQYTFSAWVKAPRLCADNDATATFGVANAETGEFLVYEPYNGNGYGAASLSTPQMQLMATSPDGEWHLRSVTFYSGTASVVNVAVSGANSRLYLDDIALYKSANGLEYISKLRTETISDTTNNGNKYCANEDSLIPAPHMTGEAAQMHWSDNPAWRNGFLSFEEVEDDHKHVLKYTASAKTKLKLTYVDWIDVLPDTQYTFTVDVKRLTSGNGRIALLDDNINNPAEFYSVSFSSTDSDWKTYSITFNTGVYSRVGLAIVDGGGCAYIDKTRLFMSSLGVTEEPEDEAMPVLKPTGGKTSVMEMAGGPTNAIANGGFEEGNFSGFDVYQSTALSGDAAHSGAKGAHLKGDGSWGALVERKNIPVKTGKTYTLSYWYKANASGTNISLLGAQTGTQYAYEWASKGEWTNITATFTIAGDTAVVFNACGGGNGIAEDVYLDDLSLLENAVGRLGVAFLMELQAYGVTRNELCQGNLTNATVDVYGDGVGYALKAMGVLVTNKRSVGVSKEAFQKGKEGSDGRMVDVPAVYLCNTSANATSYAVRITNVPSSSADVVIYARPYYVFEKDGREIVVYGDIYSRSYNNSGNDIFLD